MFSLMAKLLLNRQVKLEEGRLELMGIRDSFTPTVTYVEILRILLQSNSQHLLYDSAKKAGFDWFQRMSKLYPGLKQSEALKWGVDLIALSGWGIPTVDNFNPKEKKTIFLLKNSPVAKIFGSSKVAVDHLFRGLSAGGGSYILDANLDCVETHCVAKGDSICRFLVAPKEKLGLSKDSLKFEFGI